MKRREFVGMLGIGAACAGVRRISAQPAVKTYRVGYLSLLSGEDATLVKPLLQWFQELGYAPGKNLTFDYRSAEGQAERLTELAAELIRSSPDVLIAGGAR